MHNSSYKTLQICVGGSPTHRLLNFIKFLFSIQDFLFFEHLFYLSSYIFCDHYTVNVKASGDSHILSAAIQEYSFTLFNLLQVAASLDAYS